MARHEPDGRFTIVANLVYPMCAPKCTRTALAGIGVMLPVVKMISGSLTRESCPFACKPCQAEPRGKSNQPHALQRGMSVASNDDVIMNGDAQ